MAMSNLADNISAALGRIEGYYGGVLPWLVRLYDPKTHGFYMTVSGMLDPDMEPAIEMTAWAMSMLANYTDLYTSMPEVIREESIAFFLDRQDPVSGFYIDKQGIANQREQARNQAAALGAIKRFGVSSRYPHPRDRGDSDVKSNALIPEYMASVESYIEWVESLPWQTNSWGAGDKTQSSLQYVKTLRVKDYEEYRQALIDWLCARQLDSGLWSPTLNFNSVSGAFKVGLVFSSLGGKLPNPERIIASAFECYSVDKTSSPFFVRNPLSVLRQISSYSEEYLGIIRERLIENIDAVTASFGEFLCPDGAFSAAKGRSMISFGGVTGSHGLFEGDIDATMMMLVARAELYRLLGEPMPILTHPEFWQTVLDKRAAYLSEN